MLRLARTGHDQSRSAECNEAAFEIWLTSNPDLIKPVGQKIARADFMKMAHPLLKGNLELLSDLADRRLSLEPAGTPMRYYHSLKNYIDRALTHPKGPGAAIQEIKREIEDIKQRV